MAYEAYGPRCFNWMGWRVRIDQENGNECYAKPENLKKEKRHVEARN